MADQVHRDDTGPGDGESSEERTSPRHAAPRKPLLTRLQMPAGKAIAIAAMPTAVLMGMGLTPTLASAKGGIPKNPFSDGPCVTKADEAQHDEAEQKAEEARKKAAEAKKKKAEEDRKKAEEAEKQEEDEAKKDDGGKASPSPSTSPSGSGSSGGSSDDTSDDRPGGVLGGVGDAVGDTVDGLGDALGGVLNPGGRKDSASPSPSASPSAGDSGSKDDPVGKVTGTVGDTLDEAGKVTGTVGDTADKVGDSVGGATGTKSPEPGATGADGKKPFPCVEEKKSAGKNENTPVQLPNEGWRLEASSLLSKGLHYSGVVNLTTAGGKTKQALKFTSTDGVDIGDLHQIVPGPNGKQYHVMAAKGSTSTFRDGTVTMYMESLKGNLFGVVPVTFDPEHPPPIDLPTAFFTNVNITFAGLFGSTLTVPGLHNYITD